MAIASMVLGIAALALAWWPITSIIALILALAAIPLGIVSLVKANRAGSPKGMSIAGIATGATGFFIAIVFTVVWSFLTIAASAFSHAAGNYKYDENSSVGEAIESAGQKFGEAMESAGAKFGEAIEKAVDGANGSPAPSPSQQADY